MSKQSHTPGPWCLEPINRGRDGYGIREQDDGFIIATVHPDDGGRQYADAKLIAAAPCLLHEAHRIADEFGYTGKVTEDSVRQLMKAIAKARGEA